MTQSREKDSMTKQSQRTFLNNKMDGGGLQTFWYSNRSGPGFLRGQWMSGRNC